jgi:hypothetical protein
MLIPAQATITELGRWDRMKPRSIIKRLKFICEARRM